MELLSKPKQALKKIFGDLGRLDVFEKILKAQGLKQRREVAVFGFKELASALPKNDVGAIRQLAELIEQVEDETLKEQLKGVMDTLFTKAEKMAGLPFYQVETVTAKPFNWKGLHKPNGKGLFSRMFKRGK